MGAGAKSLISELYISTNTVDCFMVKTDCMPNECLLHKLGVLPEKRTSEHKCTPLCALRVFLVFHLPGFPQVLSF